MNANHLSLPEYTHIILSGGGLCGLSYIGIYRYLKQYNLLKKIRYLSGCSIGAIFAVLFALNLSVEEFEAEIYDILSDKVLNTFDPNALLSLMETKGIYSMERYQIKFNKLLLKKTNHPSFTLQEFAKFTGKNIYLSVFCLNTLTNEFLSNTSTPDIDLAKAICASMSIPGIFQPIQLMDKIYLDGGVGLSLPINIFNFVDTDKVLAINLSFNPIKTTEELHHTGAYIKQLAAAILFSHTFDILKEYKDKNKPFIDLINIEENPLDFLPIKVVDDMFQLYVSKLEMDTSIMYGYRIMYEYIKTKYYINKLIN